MQNTSSDTLSQRTRNALSLKPYRKRERDPKEAMPIAICNGAVKHHYRTGDGEARQYQRPGSEIAIAIPSRGF